MRQSFTVTTPATNLSLLTIQQLRRAAGLAEDDDSRDPDLDQLGDAVAADIASACNVASDGIHPPTLKQETVTETFWSADRCSEVFLSRRFVTAVSAISEAGTALVTGDYVLDGGAGMLYRVSSGRPLAWAAGALSIAYLAGFAEVPPDLIRIAMDLAQFRATAGARNPFLRGESVEVPDVESRRMDYWVGSTPGFTGAVPDEIASRLARYRSVVIA